jgi:cyclophilin family peptidyl-prolyl cis-trans isomerase
MKRTLVALLMASCAFAQKPPKPLKDGIYANFKTDFGDMKAILFDKDAPASVSLFIRLAQGVQEFRDVDGKTAKRPYYDNTTFFRVVPGQAAQAGSPNGLNTFNCGLTIKDEFLPGLKFHAGSLAVANSGAPDSGGCQFFITGQQMPSWDMKYAVFGQIVEGLDVVNKLVNVPVKDEHPIDPPKLISITITRVGAPPPVKTKK